MAIRTIRELGDEILRRKSKEVKEINESILELIDDMYETMYEALGVGLAAVQVGILKRIFVIDTMEEEGEAHTFINPEILEVKGEELGDEGCLSVKGKSGKVRRPTYVKVKAYDENMEEFILEGEGLLARAIMHEYDHLEGILYLDNVEGDIITVNE